MDINEAIYGRRSTREFTAQAIDDATVRRLVDAAVQAPSAVNQQPWRFAVLRNAQLLDRISRDAKAHLLATMAPDAHGGQFRTLLADANFHIFHHAPLLILISAGIQAPWVAEDCAMAAENLMLAAYAGGLGSCWIGLAQSYLDTPEGKHAAGLPATWTPMAPIIVGVSKEPAAPVARKEPDILWIG